MLILQGSDSDIKIKVQAFCTFIDYITEISSKYFVSTGDVKIMKNENDIIIDIEKEYKEIKQNIYSNLNNSSEFINPLSINC